MGHRISLKKNIGFQTIYQILNTCLPLITAPYLARVLGASQQGVFSYTSSVVAYFTLIAMLGTVNYGTRSVAAVRNDQEKLNYTFWSIYLLQTCITTAALLAYIGYLCFFCRENRLIASIQTLALIDCLLNINWLFFGLERFQLTVTRSIVIRILTVIAILVLVKKPADLWLYAMIMLSGTMLSNLVMWFYLPKTVGLARVKAADALRHFKPNLTLFIPLLAMSVYHTMDKTMLGLLSNYEQSGFYYNADKIVNVTIGVISGVSTVMLPRMTALISSGTKDEADSLFKTSLEGTVLAGTAMAFGIAAIANEFVPIFFGPGFEACVMLTVVLAPVLIIKSFAFTARYQYLIPHHKENAYILSVILGAVVNLIANLLLIPGMGAMGAVIGTLLAELAACIWQYVSIRKMISIGDTLRQCLVYFLAGLLMFFSVRGVSHVNADAAFKIALEVAAGVLVYAFLCALYWKCILRRVPIFITLLREERVSKREKQKEEKP